MERPLGQPPAEPFAPIGRTPALREVERLLSSASKARVLGSSVLADLPGPQRHTLAVAVGRAIGGLFGADWERREIDKYLRRQGERARPKPGGMT